MAIMKKLVDDVYGDVFKVIQQFTKFVADDYDLSESPRAIEFNNDTFKYLVETKWRRIIEKPWIQEAN